MLPAADARQLKAIADLATKQVPGPQTEAGALAFTALAYNAQRDRKGSLLPSAADPLLASLDKLLTAHSASPFTALAVEGSVRVEVERGQLDRAAERYRRFRQEHASDPGMVQRVRDRLGLLALHLGGLPAFTATTLDGAALSSDALRGKVAVVDFWATWCQPCLKEMPTLRRIQERHGDDVMLVESAWTAPRTSPGTSCGTGRPARRCRDGSSTTGGAGNRRWSGPSVCGRSPSPSSSAPTAPVLATGQRGKRLEQAVETALAR